MSRSDILHVLQQVQWSFFTLRKAFDPRHVIITLGSGSDFRCKITKLGDWGTESWAPVDKYLQTDERPVEPPHSERLLKRYRGTEFSPTIPLKHPVRTLLNHLNIIGLLGVWSVLWWTVVKSRPQATDSRSRAVWSKCRAECKTLSLSYFTSYVAVDVYFVSAINYVITMHCFMHVVLVST